MNNRVFIIGQGILAAPGENPSDVASCLAQGISPIAPLQHFDAQLPQIPLVGEVRKTNETLCNDLGLDASRGYSRTALLGLYAAGQAVTAAGLPAEELAHAALISATTVGGMDRSEIFFADYFRNNDTCVVKTIAHHDCGAATDFIGAQLGIGGFMTTINTACSSSANALMLGARMIRAGKADIVIAGGADALCRFTLNGFQALMLLSPEPCRPFDQARQGLNLGEGAAYLVLCSERIIGDRMPLAELAGWGNANDAYHQTASSPDGRGAVLAMQAALHTAGLQPSDIQYINAHGTATANNDLAESTALRTVFGNTPPFSSTKAFTGHTLAAAGAIEAVISVMALQQQMAFPNLNFHTPMEETGCVPIQEATRMPVQHILSNSFGFGGNCTSLVFKNFPA